METENIEVLLRTPIFDIGKLKDADSRIGFRPIVVKSTDWVCVIVEKDSKYLVVRQLRYGLMDGFEEFPCGMVESGESPAKAAVRELSEETGYSVDERHLRYLGCLAANPAFMTNHMHYFYVSLDTVGEENYLKGTPHTDPHENLEVYWKDRNAMLNGFFMENGSSLMAGAYLKLIVGGLLKISIDDEESLLRKD